MTQLVRRAQEECRNQDACYTANKPYMARSVYQHTIQFELTQDQLCDRALGGTGDCLEGMLN